MDSSSDRNPGAGAAVESSKNAINRASGPHPIMRTNMTQKCLSGPGLFNTLPVSHFGHALANFARFVRL
jgi:hypothetical protein